MYWQDELAQAAKTLAEYYETFLPYGNGRSYGDSCLASSDNVLVIKHLDRLSAFDKETGILLAEAGITLSEILEITIPAGWFLPVTPGTKYATLGGAIANDVHGKNHHIRGTFGVHVRRLGLVRSDMDCVECSTRDNPDLFAATIGGLGLTGLISWAEIQLVRINSSNILTFTERFDSIAEFFSISEERDHRHEFCVSWIDCRSKKDRIGRGVYFAGDFADDGSLEVASRRKLKFPCVSPISLCNSLSLRIFNEAYWRRHTREPASGSMNYEPFFYPLDFLLDWNRLYGPNGFQQYQCVIPDEDAADIVPILLREISASRTGSFLSVIKRCGKMSSPGLMSFPMHGTTLALDFPQDEAKLGSLFRRLDHIVVEAGGRLYAAKDAHMSGPDFRRAYPAWEEVEALRDPAIQSQFWQRITDS